MQIDFGSFDATMSEQFFDVGNIHALLYEVRGEGMS